MKSETPSLTDAQSAVREFLLARQRELHHRVKGEHPDEQGAYTEARGEAKDLSDAIGTALRSALLQAPAESLAERFPHADRTEALSEFLFALGDDMRLFPPEVFGQISVFVKRQYGVALPEINEEERRFELHVRTLLEASSLTEAEIREQLSQAIDDYKSRHGGEISEAAEAGIVADLCDPLKVARMRRGEHL